jgi:hypothetical protein
MAFDSKRSMESKLAAMARRIARKGKESARLAHMERDRNESAPAPRKGRNA